MSRITFLDNAKPGKNNWWRYILTISLIAIGIIGGSIAVGAVMGIVYIAYLSITGLTDPSQLMAAIYSLNSEPFFLLIAGGISYIFALLMLFIGVRFIHNRKFITLVNTDSKFDFRRVLKGAGIWSSILLVSLLVTFIMDPTGVKFSFNPLGFLVLVILSLIIFPIQASTEELFFRGYLMQGFGSLTKKTRFLKVIPIPPIGKIPVIPLILTSIFFSVGHYWNGSTPLEGIDLLLQTFVLGITLGIIVLGENRLETAMGVHIANNIFVTVIINDPSSIFGGLPSILSYTPTPNLLIDVTSVTLWSVLLLIILFWNKKENLVNIFRIGD